MKRAFDPTRSRARSIVARLDAGAAFFARQSSYLGGVEHVGVVGALNVLGTLGGLEGDLRVATIIAKYT